MAEEPDEKVEEAPAPDPVDEGEAPEPAEPSEPPQANAVAWSPVAFVAVAFMAALVTGALTYATTSAYDAAQERARPAAAQTQFEAQLAEAKQRTATVQAELEQLHRKQAIYAAHTSVVRAMQELDKSNFGSADELMRHAREALGAANPHAVAEVQKTLTATTIEVSQDRIGQLNDLRKIAKQLQAAMER
ncbi:MAG: hypothetical protein AAGA48_19185 [Myxococcota bacterium]